MKTVVSLAVVSLLAVGAGWAWRARHLQQNRDEVRHRGDDAVPVQRRTIDAAVEAIGEAYPANQVQVKSEVSGRIQSVEVVTGQWVKRQTLLVTLDDTDLVTEKSAAQTEIAGAQLRLDKAQRDFDRQRDLFRERLVSQEVFDSAKTTLELARNEIEKSQRRLQIVEDKLSKVRILAPFDGTVLNVLVSKGQVVSGATGVAQGTDLMAFADLNELIIRAHVNQVDAAKLKPEQEARITVDSLPGAKLAGRVTLIAPQATMKNNIKGFTVDVLITKTDARLRPGMNANLLFPVARVEQALTVPITAVFLEDRDRVVYVRAGNTPQRRVVTIGVADYRHCEVLTGLNDGDEVLLHRPVTPLPKS
jgi:RND family efflux transporter MFP subunit